MRGPALPQLERPFLTDGGLETDMIFNRGMDLPCFSAIWLLRSGEGRETLRSYFLPYLETARSSGTGFLLESPNWRASPDWGPRLGIDQEELHGLNRDSIGFLKQLRNEWQSDRLPIVISGCIGPRGDGYDPGEIMSVEEAAAYHAVQARSLAEARPDMLSGLTMTNVNEAVGVARAAEMVGLPVVISFTVETDGRLPAGDTLGQAISHVDEATSSYPAYYMINCAHPSHFAGSLEEMAGWTSRIGGIRANASRRSHAELDAMTELDAGVPEELGEDYRRLLARHKQIRVLGGCCGTDHRHVAAIAETCLEPAE